MSVAFSLLALAVGLYAAGLICCAIGMAHPKSVAGRLTWALLPLACLVHLLSFLTQ
ncbi:MAG: hypothetical protein HY814_11815, partial [Candidatus Riflebacteria bacterium]|nr:hypothetical protein [Candidatus Riflebacteria bacterium]